MASGCQWWTSGEDQAVEAEEMMVAEAASATAEAASMMVAVSVVTIPARTSRMDAP